MKKIETVKLVAEIVVGLGVSIIVGNVAGATTPRSAGKINKALICIGAFVLGSMVGEKATEYACRKIDEAVKSVKITIKDEEVTV